MDWRRIFAGEIQDGKVNEARQCAHWLRPGEMAEWLKAHAWKACVPQGTVGSNPTLSAILENRAEPLSSPIASLASLRPGRGPLSTPSHLS